MQENRCDPKRVIEEIKDSPHQKVKVAITDMDGILRGKYIHKDKFLSAAEGGFGFCNVIFGWDCADICYENTEYTGWHSGYPDASAVIDLTTYRKIPWENDQPFFLGHFEESAGNPLAVCPRQLLRSAVQRAESLGYTAKFALEFEWFNFKETPQSLAEKGHSNFEPLTPGMFGYSILRSSLNNDYFTAIMDDLLAFDVPVEGLHTETGPGVYEAAIMNSDPLEAADRAVLFKTGVKEIGYRHEVMPTFMAKWNPKLPGCSGHIHQSIWDHSGDQNLFYAGNDEFKMSDAFRHYLAGQMHCIPEILPFLAPNVNSYKRLVEGLWAPTRVTWGVDNRTVAFRVIPGSSKSTRLETRVGGSDVNPYLAIAATLQSGIYGIDRKIDLETNPIRGNGYEARDATRLPKNLYEASVALSKSEVARELFGGTFVDHFVHTRIWEWEQSQKSVTSWELERYFEII